MSGANTRSVLARLQLITIGRRGNILLKLFSSKTLSGRWRGARARAGWLVFENKFGKVVEKSSDFILCLFGFVKATKFRDSSEYSQCVQDVLAKSYLPCQILYKPIFFFFFFCWALKGLGTSFIFHSFFIFFICHIFNILQYDWHKRKT